MQAAQRAKVAASTQAEAGNPLGSQYGDTPLYKSPAQATETYWSINSLSEEQSGQKVLTLQDLPHHLVLATVDCRQMSGAGQCVGWTYAFGLPDSHWKRDAGASERQCRHSTRTRKVLFYCVAAGTGNSSGKSATRDHICQAVNHVKGNFCLMKAMLA